MRIGTGAATLRIRSVYGARPSHLVAMCLSLVGAGYVLRVVDFSTLWEGPTWWQSIGVWFIAAAVIHDLIIFPLYTLADVSLAAGLTALRRRAPVPAPPVPPVNYIRCPLLATGLVLLLFFPGIIEQGSSTFTNATGLTQQPYLERFLWLSASFFAVSALCYAVAVARTLRKHSASQPATSPS